MEYFIEMRQHGQIVAATVFSCKEETVSFHAKEAALAELKRQALFAETDCSVSDESGAHVAHFSAKVGGYRG